MDDHYRIVGTVNGACGGTDWDPADDTGILHRVSNAVDSTASASATVMDADVDSADSAILRCTLRGIRPGRYEYKVTRGGNWTVNYGEGGDRNGDNMVVEIPEPATSGSADASVDVVFTMRLDTHVVRHTLLDKNGAELSGSAAELQARLVTLLCVGAYAEEDAGGAAAAETLPAAAETARALARKSLLSIPLQYSSRGWCYEASIDACDVPDDAEAYLVKVEEAVAERIGAASTSTLDGLADTGADAEAGQARPTEMRLLGQGGLRAGRPVRLPLRPYGDGAALYFSFEPSSGVCTCAYITPPSNSAPADTAAAGGLPLACLQPLPSAAVEAMPLWRVCWGECSAVSQSSSGLNGVTFAHFGADGKRGTVVVKPTGGEGEQRALGSLVAHRALGLVGVQRPMMRLLHHDELEWAEARHAVLGRARFVYAAQARPGRYAKTLRNLRVGAPLILQVFEDGVDCGNFRGEPELDEGMRSAAFTDADIMEVVGATTAVDLLTNNWDRCPLGTRSWHMERADFPPGNPANFRLVETIERARVGATASPSVGQGASKRLALMAIDNEIKETWPCDEAAGGSLKQLQLDAQMVAASAISHERGGTVAPCFENHVRVFFEEWIGATLAPHSLPALQRGFVRALRTLAEIQDLPAILLDDEGVFWQEAVASFDWSIVLGVQTAFRLALAEDARKTGPLCEVDNYTERAGAARQSRISASAAVDTGAHAPAAQQGNGQGGYIDPMQLLGQDADWPD